MGGEGKINFLIKLFSKKFEGEGKWVEKTRQ